MVELKDVESVMDLPEEVIGTFFKTLRIVNGSMGAMSHDDVVKAVMGRIGTEKWEDGVRICGIIIDECSATRINFNPSEGI